MTWRCKMFKMSVCVSVCYAFLSVSTEHGRFVSVCVRINWMSVSTEHGRFVSAYVFIYQNVRIDRAWPICQCVCPYYPNVRIDRAWPICLLVCPFKLWSPSRRSGRHHCRCRWQLSRECRRQEGVILLGANEQERGRVGWDKWMNDWLSEWINE